MTKSAAGNSANNRMKHIIGIEHLANSQMQKLERKNKKTKHIALNFHYTYSDALKSICQNWKAKQQRSRRTSLKKT